MATGYMMPLLSGIIILIAGIFIFGFNDYVYALLASDRNNNLESPKIGDTLTTKINSKENQISEKNNEILLQESPNLDFSEDLTSFEESDKTNDILIDESKILTSKTIKTDFETEIFYLKGSGDSWIKSKQTLSSPFEISAMLIPQKDTKLSKFDLIDSEIFIGEKNYKFNSGIAEISKSKFFLSIYSNDDRIFFSMDGSFDYKIKDSIFSGKIKFEEKPFYIYENNNQQHMTSFDATLSTSSNGNN